MPKRRSIAPRACKVMWEEHTADCTGGGPEPFALPGSFPRGLLDDFQLSEVAAWYGAFMEDLLHRLQQALLCARTRSNKADAEHPVNLQNYIVHAVLLGHLLRLHPSTEASLPELAREMGVSERRLYYAQDCILEQLGAAAVEAFRGERSARYTLGGYLSGCRELLPGRSVREGSVLTIPFRKGVPMAARFAVVKKIAGLAGVGSVRESLMPDDRNAITITLK